MRLTFEEASIVRKLMDELPESVPRPYLTEQLRLGNIERVARVASIYHHRGKPGAVEFFVLALMKSGTHEDIALAIRLLTEAYGGEAIHDPDAYVVAANWISRFDFSEVRSSGEDLGLKLHTLAKVAYYLDKKVGSASDRVQDLQKELERAKANNLSVSDARAFLALFWVKNHCHELAFHLLKTALSEDSVNPYLRMTANALFSAVPAEDHSELILYGKYAEPTAYGISAIGDCGYLCKSYTGEGFARNAAGLFVDANYSPVRAIGSDELQNLEFSKFRKKTVSAFDGQWGKLLKQLDIEDGIHHS